MPKKKTQRRDTFASVRTKAEWLRSEFFPDDPEFPLDAEVIASIPPNLRGEVPTNPTELYADEPNDAGHDDADELLDD
jgi:hypothetical protein